MSTLATDAALDRHSAATGAGVTSAVTRARAGLYLGAATSTVYGAVTLFAKTSSGTTFHHAADYWITALGIPFMLAPLLFLPALHKLHRGRDGRLGLAGLAISSIGLVTYLPPLSYSLVVGAERSFGPTYMLATLATFVGLALFAIATFRARMLPRSIPPLWLIAWILGGPLLVLNGMPLLLTAVYLAIANYLPTHEAA